MNGILVSYIVRIKGEVFLLDFGLIFFLNDTLIDKISP